MGEVFRDACLICGGRDSTHLLEKEGARYVRCPACGLIYTNPAPDEQTLYDIAEEWASKHHASPERLEWEKEQRLQDVLFGSRMKIINRYRRLGRILDVGCSTGYFLEYAARNGWEVAGCELASYTARIARERMKADIREGSFLETGFSGEYFDAVTMWDVIEHTLDPAAFIAEAFRILRPSGLLVIATPNYNSLSRRLLGDIWEAIIPSRHLVLFTPDTLTRMIARAGGRAVRIRTVDINPFVLLSGIAGRTGGHEGRVKKVARVKRLFSRLPALSHVRDGINAVLTLHRLGDVLEVYAERAR